MKICPHCNRENPLSANFCNHCATDLRGICLQCGTVNQTDAIYCMKCGEKLAKEEFEQEKKTTRKAERRQLTILFSDLVGSTTLSEKLDAEEYRQAIMNYHKVAEQVIKKFGGHIAQYLGDGLLVYFGYPEGLEDAPKVAVKSGLGIIDAMAKANAKWKSEGKPELQTRIGVHTGLVVVDEKQALGDTVNIAARLEGLAPHNGVVVSTQTRHLVKGYFQLSSLGKHTLKGISEPMEIYQVLAETDVKTRLEAARDLGLSPLVGRDDHLRKLIGNWELVRNGKGHMTIVSGEAGIGKSRLIDAMISHISDSPEHRILVAQASFYQRNSAFSPLIELFEKSILQYNPGDDTAEKLNKLIGFLSTTQLDLKSTVPLMAEFLSIQSEEIPSLVMSPFAKRQLIMDTLSVLFLELPGNKPLLFILEDLHWTDPSTLEWLNKFCEQIPTHPILLLCSSRPDYRSPLLNLEHVMHIELERLNAENMQEICHHQTGGRRLPDEILHQIAGKTEGVPLFVEELTKMILESELLIKKEEVYEMKGSLSTMEIPSTLQDSLMARLDRLSNSREIVQMGSVLGREFSFDMLNAVLPQLENQIELALSQLVEAEIFYCRKNGQGSIYQFKHALIQDAAYQSLLKKHRQQMHHHVANVLENQLKATIKNQPEILAHHYTEAGQSLKAIPVWLQAGQIASQKNATSEAITHLQKGIGLLTEVEDESQRNNWELDFYLTLGGTYVVSHGFPHPKVKETFNKAMDIAQTTQVNPKLALVLMNLLSYYFNIEDYDTHKELIEYVFKLSEDPENGYWFDLIGSQTGGCPDLVRGRLESGCKHLKHVIDIFDPSFPFPWELAPSGYIEVGAKGWLMIGLQIIGQWEQAKILRDNHLNFAKEHKDSMTLYHVYIFPAIYELERKEWKAVERIMDEYLPIVKEFGDPIFILSAEIYHSIALAFQGDKSAFEKAVQLTNIAINVGFKAFAYSVSSWVGELYYIFEDYDSALSYVQKILDHVEESGSHMHTAELYRIKGLILKELGESVETVEKQWIQALEISRNQSAKSYELRISTELASLWAQQGKSKEAKTILEEICQWFPGDMESVELNEAHLILSKLEKE